MKALVGDHVPTMSKTKASLQKYDPVIGRWHAPDPLEQFHSPYLANYNYRH
jgi:hypothetical protein